jgi:hypothetical protein
MGNPDNLDLNLDAMKQAIQKAEDEELDRLRQLEQEAKDQ